MMASEVSPTQRLQTEGHAKDVDLVFEGGGLKGIAFVGAYSALEEHGYRPQNLAGASAGAIVAALIAAGYTPAGLREVIGRLDLPSLEDPRKGRLPVFSRAVSILEHRGLYEGKALLRWLTSLLEAKGVRTFGDLVRRPDAELRYRYKLQVIASDLTAERLLVDGGMLSNFPVWLFDSDEPLWPTIGVKFIEEDPRAPLAAPRVGGGIF